jgi:cytochrome bd-type quinol oxidase subunit 1
MNDRLKILGIFAALGFVGGIIANVAFNTVWPWLLATLPALLSAEWIISGVAGAVITTCFVVIWVYLTQPREQ